VTVPHDDLPRSPTGRVPQWVVDEAAGFAVPPPAWRTDDVPPPPPPRRRSLVGRLAVVVALALGGWWVVTAVLPGFLREVDAPFLDGIVAGRVPEPTAEVAALATEMFLTDEGRDLLYRSEPELLGAAEFAGRCDRGDAPVGQGGGAVGCYHTAAGGLQTGGRIVVYEPEDPRLRGFVVETAAHELLHAAWNELTADEQATAVAALEPVVAGIDPADDVHGQLAGSVGATPANRGTELFAYIGTQVWQPGGLDPALEGLYARFVADREALVGVHTAFEQQLDQLTAEYETTLAAFEGRQMEQVRATMELDADTNELAQYRATIEEEEARLASLPASQRARSLLSWTWRDGTVLPQAPADELLAEARALLARDEAELAARTEALRATGEEILAEQARITTVRVELEALLGQLVPG